MEIRNQPEPTGASVEVPPGVSAGADRNDVVPGELERTARGVLAAQRVIAATMPPGFAGEPAVLILLELFTDPSGTRTSTLTGLASAVGLSPTGLARWCKALAQERLIRMGPAIALTEHGTTHIAGMLSAVSATRARIHTPSSLA